MANKPDVTHARLLTLADMLEKKIQDPSITDERIREKIKVSESQYYRIKPQALEMLNERLAKRLQAREAMEIKAIQRQAQTSIKTKQQRLEAYQAEIEYMTKQLTGEVVFNFMAGKKLKSSHDETGTFRLPVEVQNKLRDRIRWYQIEISKIEGDYAAQVVNVRGSFLDIMKEASIVQPGQESPGSPPNGSNTLE